MTPTEKRPTGREAQMARTFVELADTMTKDFDLVEMTQTLVERCVELFGATAAGLLLADAEGTLGVVASSSDQMRTVELFELQSREGPCLDSYQTGQPVINQDLEEARDRWPRFVPVAMSAGFRSVHALPVRLRNQVVGALNLFRNSPGILDELDVAVAQAFADATAIAILQQRVLHDAKLLAHQLQFALDSRILIEQAKGMVAERGRMSITEAFTCIRRYARDHNQQLTAVCQAVTEGTLTLPEPSQRRP